MIRIVFGVFTLLALLISTPLALAQEKTGAKEGFFLNPDSVRIALLDPRVRVGEQSTGGMFEPNADWTEQARENIEAELSKSLQNVGNEVIRLDLNVTPDADSLRRYNHLFGAVAGSVVEFQFFHGNRLPSKKKEETFSWSVGTGLKDIPALEGFDYILLIRTSDAYGSTGRKMLQVVGLLGGIGVTSGEHTGMAGLIEVETGDLVWLNADLQMGGDPRTAEGAEKRVKQLLEGFPGREGEQE